MRRRVFDAGRRELRERGSRMARDPLREVDLVQTVHADQQDALGALDRRGDDLRTACSAFARLTALVWLTRGATRAAQGACAAAAARARASPRSPRFSTAAAAALMRARRTARASASAVTAARAAAADRE